jgi:hypothetical protein
MSVRKQILDPLSTLCKIALLTFYENGSKLSIYDNIIEVQRSEGKQWIIRTYRGDCKEHISLLYNPIVKAIHWYIFPNLKQNKLADTENKISEHNYLDEKKIKSIKSIMCFAIDGLRRLKQTYKDGNVVLALQLLINNLKIATSDEPSFELFEDYNDNINFEDSGILNYEKIKEIWNSDTMSSISNQFALCDKYKDNKTELDNILESLNLMLKNTDSKFKKLVIDMNSTL